MGDVDSIGDTESVCTQDANRMLRTLVDCHMAIAELQGDGFGSFRDQFRESSDSLFMVGERPPGKVAYTWFSREAQPRYMLAKFDEEDTEYFRAWREFIAEARANAQKEIDDYARRLQRLLRMLREERMYRADAILQLAEMRERIRNLRERAEDLSDRAAQSERRRKLLEMEVKSARSLTVRGREAVEAMIRFRNLWHENDGAHATLDERTNRLWNFFRDPDGTLAQFRDPPPRPDNPFLAQCVDDINAALVQNEADALRCKAVFKREEDQHTARKIVFHILATYIEELVVVYRTFVFGSVKMVDAAEAVARSSSTLSGLRMDLHHFLLFVKQCRAVTKHAPLVRYNKAWSAEAKGVGLDIERFLCTVVRVACIRFPWSTPAVSVLHFIADAVLPYGGLACGLLMRRQMKYPDVQACFATYAEVIQSLFDDVANRDHGRDGTVVTLQQFMRLLQEHGILGRRLSIGSAVSACVESIPVRDSTDLALEFEPFMEALARVAALYVDDGTATGVRRKVEKLFTKMKLIRP